MQMMRQCLNPLCAHVEWNLWPVYGGPQQFPMITGSLSSLVIQRWQGGSLSVSLNMFAVAVYNQYVVSSYSVLLCNQDTTAGIAISYRLDGWGGLNTGRSKTLSFPKLFRTALGPTQPPSPWILRFSYNFTAAGAWRWPLTYILCRS
jgi:hypothetical protein